MNKEAQEKYRAALIEKYEQRAWECLALYGYYGRQFSEIEKGVDEMEKRIKDAEDKIREIEGGADHYTVDNKNKVKVLKKDCQDYEGRIKSVSETAKKMFEKAAAYREEGVRALECVEEFRAFGVKTPEEIAADKAKVEVPVESVVAGAETK